MPSFVEQGFIQRLSLPVNANDAIPKTDLTLMNVKIQGGQFDYDPISYKMRAFLL